MKIESSKDHEVHLLPLASGCGSVRVSIYFQYDPPVVEIGEVSQNRWGLSRSATIEDLPSLAEGLLRIYRELKHPNGILSAQLE